MAASKSVSDDQKFMDVARPGKGKVVGTSRPVAGPIVSASKTSNIEVVSDEKEEKVSLSAPSESRKVIQPLAESDLPDDAPQSAALSGNDSPVIESVDIKPKVSAETAEVSETTEEKVVPEETDDHKKDETHDTDDPTSESAGVDALAAKAETKKQAAKRAEEALKQDEHLQTLTDSKEYFVPIGHSVSSSRKKPILIVITLLMLAVGAGAYYLVTSSATDNQVNTSTQPDTSSEINSNPKTEQENPAATEPVATEADQSSTVASRDAERKDELKNLQKKLEMYFNDNDTYPSAATWVEELALSADEMTGPSQDAYTYTPVALSGIENQSFNLAAQLENAKDKDANESGMYVIQSVNN